MESFFAVVGALVCLALVGWAAVRCLGWLWRHVLRRSPVKGLNFVGVGTIMKRLQAVGWDINLTGLMVGKHLGFGIITAHPPQWQCETCRRRFRTEEDVIKHEKAVGHGEAGAA